MGLSDKIRNATTKLSGKAKEARGSASGDNRLKNEGRGDQTRADLKQAAEKVKDAFRRH